MGEAVFPFPPLHAIIAIWSMTGVKSSGSDGCLRRSCGLQIEFSDSIDSLKDLKGTFGKPISLEIFTMG
jgi:hypothetical protein